MGILTSRHHTRSTAVAINEWTIQAQGAGQYADVNGINLYYKTHGTGRPLILLHRGLGSGEMFGPILPALADARQVILLDLHRVAPARPTSTGPSASG